jgi:NAD(P)H dehydrogenase (quinone)
MPSNTTKKILIINGNPAKQRSTFSEALAKSYAHHAQNAGHRVTSMKLADLSFDPIQHEGYASEQPLEPDLITLREAMAVADHWVMIFPLWYALPPALFKGFIERIFTKGFAFEYEGRYPVPLPILKGKTVRIIITCSMPIFVYQWFSGKPAQQAMKTLFGLCGMKISGFTVFAGIADPTPQGAVRFNRYIESLQGIGKNGI